jgi:hypothetical protein
VAGLCTRDVKAEELDSPLAGVRVWEMGRTMSYGTRDLYTPPPAAVLITNTVRRILVRQTDTPEVGGIVNVDWSFA